MLERAENFFLQFVRRERENIRSYFLIFALTPLSWIYGIYVALRNSAYDLGLLQSRPTPGHTVISIGNLVIGGAGKTPVTMMLTSELITRFPLAILSRGYRSHAEDLNTPLVLSDGKGPQYPPNLAGDEPFLLAENFPTAFVIVGKNRRRAVKVAMEKGAQVILLDDGMQHRQLARDLEIVVMDANDSPEKSKLLPLGFFREGLSSLKRADLIILNHLTSPEHYASASKFIAKYTNAPVVGTQANITTVLGEDNLPIDIKNKKVGIFCGIANPKNFEQTLRLHGVEIVAEIYLKDHGHIDEHSLKLFAEKCKSLGAEYIVCTEKDKVKLSVPLQSAIPLAWIKIRLEIKEGAIHWNEFIKKTITLVNRNK